MFLTFFVLKFDKFNDINFSQPLNISDISVHDSVLKFDKSTDSNTLHPLNI